ncbi:MAG TPA: hypothetical protein VM889_07705 [Candidatus Thermoplasmatota archaeon]|nr:hypothetical protein [Candidatus Thermoplasmatota archaeon]
MDFASAWPRATGEAEPAFGTFMEVSVLLRDGMHMPANTPPARLIRSPQDLKTHEQKGRVLGIGAEDHARLMHLFLKCRVDSKGFRGLTGPALAARIGEVWSATYAPAGAAPAGLPAGTVPGEPRPSTPT